MTAAERKHLNRLAAMGCVLCKVLRLEQNTPTTIHHLRDGRGMAQRSAHWLAIPLCFDCHQGGLGIHGDRTLLRMAKMEELDLLGVIIEALEAA